jgi:hypothetical protein
MHCSLKSVLFAASFFTSLTAAAECTMPDTPALPDGASSTMEEMIAGQTAVKAFQADAQAFRSCLDAEMGSLKAAASDGDEAAAAAFKMKTDAYNASVASEETLANNFNAEIRAYKEANAK